MFISYNWKSSKNQVIQLDEKLSASGLKVWRDENFLENSNNPLLGQITNAIRQSKVVVCCITEDYCRSHNCNLEIGLANTLRKPLVVLMIDKLDFHKKIQVNDYEYESCVPIIIK